MSSVLKRLREQAEMRHYEVGRDELRAAKGLFDEPFRMDVIVRKKEMEHLAPLADLVWNTPHLDHAVAFIRGYLGMFTPGSRRNALLNLRWLQKFG